jgi:TRAP-type C4-dicarboxylate transport system substrate-binding protein
MMMRRKKLSIMAGIFLVVLTFIFMPADRVGAESKVYNLKFANFFPPKAKHSKLAEEFIQELEKRTGGRIKTRYFAGGSLLKAPAIYKGVASGIADFGYAHVEYTPGRFPVTEACDLPLGYPSGWVANQVVNDFYNKFKPKEWDKVKLLMLNTSTPNVIISKKPVRKLEDLKGMTIRAPGRVGNTIKALGATPAPTPIMEVYDGIAKGVIDGVNTPFETLKTFRFAEVAKYTTSSWPVGNLYTFYVIMNKNSYEKLPPDLKEILDKLSGEYKEKFGMMWNMVDFEGKEFARAKGVEIIELSPEEVIRWKKATEPVVQDYISNMVSKGYSETEVKGWIQYLRDRIEYWTAKQIEYRVKSPTGPDAMRP